MAADRDEMVPARLCQACSDEFDGGMRDFEVGLREYLGPRIDTGATIEVDSTVRDLDTQPGEAAAPDPSEPPWSVVRAELLAARPPVEHYARCTETIGDLIYEPGIEVRDGDDLPALRMGLACVVSVLAGRVAERGQIAAMRSIGEFFERNWPGRAWFVEIHDAHDGSWTQSYQPYGIPRAR